MMLHCVPEDLFLSFTYVYYEICDQSFPTKTTISWRELQRQKIQAQEV